jgi:hypothetical protein
MTATVALSAIQRDRAAGVLLGAACGDALGVTYEFQPPLAAGDQPEMRGGGLGPYAPGEKSDDGQFQVQVLPHGGVGVPCRVPHSEGLHRDSVPVRPLGHSGGGATSSQV